VKISDGKNERFGKYKLLNLIATGGMAEVFLAEIRQPRNIVRQCIIKRILPGFSQKKEFVDALVDEARLGVALSHPNLVTTLEFNETDSRLFLALEYVDGPDLGALHSALARSGKRIPIDIACAIMIEVLKGLNYAHNAMDKNGNPLGIVHRDINPPNILLSRSGAVKVADFGIAHAADRLTRTGFGQLKGKIPYMSPEQASGKKIDHKSDLWSCGVMFFEILTGGRLFAGTNEMEVLKLVREALVLAPSTFRNEVDKELDNICLRALAKDPNNRFDSAEHFGLTLSAYFRKNHPDYQQIALGKLVMSSVDHWQQTNITREKTAVLKKNGKISNQEKTTLSIDKNRSNSKKKNDKILWIASAAAILSFVILFNFWFGTSENIQHPEQQLAPTTQMEIDGGNSAFVLLDGKLLGTAPLATKIMAKRKSPGLIIARGGIATYKTSISIKEHYSARP